MANETSKVDESITKLCETINQNQQTTAIAGLNIPEFGGLPGEDVKEFLNRFKIVTFTLNNELKCIALRKALVGSARIWAKNNLKELINAGDWKSAKEALEERFQAPDHQERFHQKLANMRYDPKTVTLRSYVEGYAACFRKAHKTATDKNIIESLVQNLPKDIKHTLNLISETWRTMTELKDLYPVIKRVEQTILPYAPAIEEPAERLDVTTMSKLLKQMQEDFKNDCLEKIKAETKASSEEAIAALGRIQNQRENNASGNPPQSTTYRNTHYFGPRYNRRDQTQMDNSNQNQQRRPPQPMLPNNATSESTNQMDATKSNSQALQSAYEQKFGVPPGPCRYCRQNHFNRHCPYINHDLK